jgi:ABC-type sugar transport system permease subunit
MHTATEYLETRQRRPRARELLRRVKKNWAAYVFISPFYILFAVFGLFSLIFSFYISFHRWDGLTPMRWWGLGNYVELFKDDKFLISIRNTGILLLFDLPLKVFTPLLLAVALNSRLVKGQGFFRTFFYLPEVTSAVVVAIIFSYFFSGDTSIVNYFIQQLGGPRIPWLTDRFWAKISLVLLSGWWSQGYHMIIYLAGLQSIPQEVTEAAVVDGANRVQVFTKITLPLLRPVIVFSAIITVNHGLQRFAEPYLLTGGGPAYGTLTMILYLYRKAFEGFRLGYSAAMAYVIFAMIFVASFIQLKFGGRGQE